MELTEIETARIVTGLREQRFLIDDSKLDDLAASMTSIGLVNPITVREEDGKYQMIAGHRRLEAAKSLHWTMIQAIVLKGADEVDDQITFSENFFRADLSPVELACAIDKQYQTGKMTVEKIGKIFHRSVDWVRRQIGITNWPEDVLQICHAGHVSVAAAANLALIEEEEYRKFLCGQAEQSGASARTTAAWLQAWRAMLPPSEAIESPLAPGASPQKPQIPQAPCFRCGHVERVDGLSHVPICKECIRFIRG